MVEANWKEPSTSSSIPKKINQHMLKAALIKRKGFTIDINATEITSQKAEVKWTYYKILDYMPMVAHIVKFGVAVASDL